MGLPHLLFFPLLVLLLVNKREVNALDIDVSEPQLVAEGGQVELTCQVNSSPTPHPILAPTILALPI